MFILLLHGYSGSPKNFFNLEKDLKKKGYTLLSPSLPFHQSASELSKAGWDDFYKWFVSYLKDKKDVVIVGYSLGAQLAMSYDSPSIIGRIAIAPPFFPKFPFSCSFLGVLGRNIIFPKFNSSDMVGLNSVPLRGLKIIKDGNNKRVIKSPPDVEIHLSSDFLSRIKNPLAHNLLCEKQNHNPFTGSTYKKTREIIFKYLSSFKKPI